MSSAATTDFMVADPTPEVPTVPIVEANADGESTLRPMRLMAAVALGCGFIAAPMVGAAGASASPGTCDGAACVTYVERGAVLGDACVQNTRYNLGLTASGATLACSANRVWIASPPLIGVRTVRSQCGESKGV